MLRLLREKGLQTPFVDDTLNPKSGDGRALLRPRHAAIGLRPGREPGKPAGCGGPAKNRGPAAAGRQKAGAAALDGLQPQAMSTGRLQRQRGESGPTADPLCKTAAGGSVKEDSFWSQQNEKPENFSFDAGEASQEAEKIPWNTWENYEKVVQDGQEYALVGGRPYSHHAVDRMQPSGRRYAAAGSIFQAAEVESRSVAPQFMEEILQRVRLLFQPQTGNFEHKIGTVKIITNSKGSVVTIMIYQ